MNILIIASWYYSSLFPNRGSFIREQAHALTLEGHCVSVVVFDRDSKAKLFELNQTADGNVREFRISLPSPMHRIIGFYFPWLLAKTMQHIISIVQPDVIHAHAVRPAATVLSKLETMVPILITEHGGPISMFWWTHHGKRQIVKAYHQASQVFCVGTELKRELKRYFGINHPEVLPNGIDTALFQKAMIEEKENYVLVVSSLIRGKRVDDILRAFSSVTLSYKLVILGDGPEQENLQSLAQKLDIKQKVDFIGNVSRELVAQYLRKAFAFIHASEHETFGLVCAEAIASGTKVICSKSGGPEDFVVSPYGEFFEVGDIERLTALINELEDFEYTQDWIDQAHSYIADNFSMANLAKRLTQQYQAVVNA